MTPALFLAACLGLSMSQPVGSGTPEAAPVRQPAERLFDLMVGDAAPPLLASEWIKGQPFTAFAPGHTYIIEFWATWCGPCLAGMPHLSELQAKYGTERLTVVGVTGLDKWGNTPESIRALVERKGDIAAYSFVIDQESDSERGYLGVFRGRTQEAYLAGAGTMGIPILFVVNGEGRIAHIGTPAAVDAVLDEVISGTYDIDRAAADYARRKRAERDTEELTKLLGEGKSSAELSKRIFDDGSDDPFVLVQLAQALLSVKPGSAGRDVGLALRAAQRAADLTQSRDPVALVTLASAQGAGGDTQTASQTVERAIQIAEGAYRDAIVRDRDQITGVK